MNQYMLLTTDRYQTVVPPDLKAECLGWLAELALQAHRIVPAPYVREVPGLGLLLDVAATRWVGRTASAEICYMVAGTSAGKARMGIRVDGSKDVVYRWTVPPVEPPKGLARWAEVRPLDSPMPQIRIGRPK